MAKEMMIIFIYDTARCRKEDDDPAEAVLYFHPGWVSPTQRLALAGQLMGINYFLSSCFSPPKLIALQSGKFVLKKFGQYILAVGTDRNIHDWILERRANCLESILKFFHCDLESISLSLNCDRTKFSEKLYQMLETYLPILQYSANLFSNMPMIKLPNTASNVFLESMQVLQYCQEMNGIHGGVMFYNNKVVATQLTAELTKQLVITDPYRIRAPADRITTDFHLPMGVQLLRVYIQRKQSFETQEESSTIHNSTTHFDIIARKNRKPSLPISGMKRDTSRIFTVPEEGEPDVHAIPPEISQPSKRPSTLPIQSNTYDKKPEFKPKYVNLLTPSVCSTPLKDVNRILHGNAVSICSGTEEWDRQQISLNNEEQNIDDIPDVVKEALRCKRLNKFRNMTKMKIDEKVKNEKWSRRSSSLTRLEETKKMHKTNINPLITLLESSYSNETNTSQRKRIFKTITDPKYPVFKPDGSPISQHLYDHYISIHYQELSKVQNIDCINSTKLTNGVEHNSIPKSTEVETNDRYNIDGFDMVMIPDTAESIPNSLDVRLNNKARQETYRRSMSLPLKSLNAPIKSDDRRKSTSEYGDRSFDLPPRRKLEGVQLTPLMSKLSLLATDERTSGFCSKDTTPSEFCDLSSRLTRSNKSETVGKTITTGDEDEDDFWLNDKESSNKDSGCLEKAELFICGQHSMVLMLLMEDGTANNPELIHKLWQTCMNTLGRLESRLQHCLEPLPSSDHKELYSVLCIDPQWDTLHRSGLWGVTEFDIVSSLHNRFSKTSNLTDIIVRTEDTVIYGSQCGRTEVFYQQSITPNTSGGLPTPADLMGIVSLKAKRLLERDHGIIIL